MEEQQSMAANVSEYREVMRKLSDVYAAETTKNADASNQKIDKLSEILMQIGFAVAGLASTRILGHFSFFPFTLIAIFSATFSIICGGIQVYIDHKFFTKEMVTSRELASLALAAWMSPTKESHAKFNEKFHQKREESSGSIFLAFQVTFLILSIVLIFFELNKVI